MHTTATSQYARSLVKSFPSSSVSALFLICQHRFGQPMETSSNELFTAVSDFMEKFETINQERIAKKQAESHPPISARKASGKGTPMSIGQVVVGIY